MDEKCICGQSGRSSFADRMGAPTIEGPSKKIWVHPAVPFHESINSQRVEFWISHIFSTGSCIHSMMVTSAGRGKTPAEAESKAMAFARDMLPKQLTLW